MSRYLAFSRTPYYSVVAALPLLVAYELLLTLDGAFAEGQIRNAADVWLRSLLGGVGLSPFHATLAMILGLILAIPLMQQRAVPLEGRYFLGMLMEAILFGFLLGIAINYILAFFFSLFLSIPAGLLAETLPLAMPRNAGLRQGLALSLGAGLFEEFFFRVLLLNGLLFLSRLFLSRWAAAIFSITAAAFLFSLAHYIGPLGETLEIQSFLFRWIAGLLFTVLFYMRGFAVTAFSHAFYDIFVLTGLFRIAGW